MISFTNFLFEINFLQEAWTNQEQLFSKITNSNKRDIEHLLNFLNFEIKYILRPRSAPSVSK